ncbi:4Fe-4S binding protein [uncultured Desulfuromusa sp.]|uniref:4Fe-4S binding protein n=1 Tax=uncultured Desulfuromusa sp. TaxID=219183 RepID=UPI003748DD85
MSAVTILNKCTGCGACVVVCPVSALTLDTEHPDGTGRKKAVVNNNLCYNCGTCFSACRHQALIFFLGEER